MKVAHLNIYKCAYELAKLATRIQPDMNRAYRDSVGKDIRGAAKEIIKGICYANAARDEARVEYIKQVLDLAESVAIDFRVAAELRLISREFWSQSIQITGSLEKQAGGWLKASRKTPDALGSRL